MSRGSGTSTGFVLYSRERLVAPYLSSLGERSLVHDAATEARQSHLTESPEELSDASDEIESERERGAQRRAEADADHDRERQRQAQEEENERLKKWQDRAYKK